MNALNNEQILSMAPSIFAEAPWIETSPRYTFIKTIDAIEAMRREHWVPVRASQTQAKTPERVSVNKHIVRFRQETDLNTAVKEFVPEVVLINSHDATSAFQIHAGIFRIVCLNGLVVADSTFQNISIRHTGDVTDILAASYQVMSHFPGISEEIKVMRARIMQPREQIDLAHEALHIKYSDVAPEDMPFSTLSILQPRRAADAGNDLWHVFNRLQENIMVGGQPGRTQNGRKIKSRSVGAIARDVSINKGLWSAAKSYLQ